MAPPISLKKGGLQQWAVLFNRLQRCLGGGWLAAALSLPRRSPQPKAAQGLLQSPTGALDAVGAWPARAPEGIQEPAAIRPDVSTGRDMGGDAGGCFSPAMVRICKKVVR